MTETKKGQLIIRIKGVLVRCVAEFVEDEGTEYTTTEQDTRNLNRAINAYWLKLGKPENIVNDLNSEPKFP